jgi:glycosyltransferase involved in cell wall biosynthesis
MIKIGVHKKTKLSGGPANFFNRLIDSVVENQYAKVVGTRNILQDVGLYSSVVDRFNLNPYVIRIDGIYFDKEQTSGSNVTLNKRIFKSIDRAQGVVFQSNFSKNLVEAHYGKIKSPYVIILNGAPLRDVKRKNNHKKIIICSANWRAHKRLNSIISVVGKLKEKVDCELLVLGDTESVEKSSHEFVKYIGKVDKNIVLKYLERADLFIHLAWLDPCPNSVIEAISCGVPVVCSNEGGTPEIVRKTGCGRIANCDIKVDYSDLVDLYNPPIPDIDEIVKEAEYVLENSEFILSNMDRTTVDIKHVSKKYVNFLDRVIRKV